MGTVLHVSTAPVGRLASQPKVMVRPGKRKNCAVQWPLTGPAAVARTGTARPGPARSGSGHCGATTIGRVPSSCPANAHASAGGPASYVWPYKHPQVRAARAPQPRRLLLRRCEPAHRPPQAEGDHPAQGRADPRQQSP